MTIHLAAYSSVLWSVVCDARVKDPTCCLSCLSLLPANAPVPSNTDKYCPNPELLLHTETAKETLAENRF